MEIEVRHVYSKKSNRNVQVKVIGIDEKLNLVKFHEVGYLAAREMDIDAFKLIYEY